MKNNEKVHRICSDLTSITRGVTFQLGGRKASDANNRVIHDCLQSWVLLAIEAMDFGCSDVAMTVRLRNFAQVLVRTDFTDVLATLDSAYRILISGSCAHYGDFKDRLSSSPCDLLILSPINWIIDGWYRTGEKVFLAAAIQFLRYPSKLSFSMETLEDAALEGYLANEDRLRSHAYDGNPYTGPVNQILRDWLAGFKMTALPVRHGPGSVAEGSMSKADKYMSLRSDARINYVLSRDPSFGDPELFYPFGLDVNLKTSRTAKVVFVPKNATKLRVICMEPVTLQYFQQGVMRCLSRYFRENPDIRQHIQLSDQSPNQRLAKVGSTPGLIPYATIDLSAASDSVSWSLARRLFHGTPLMKWLLATRSTRVQLPDGSSMDTVKFAPMGSALCFPIECLIFAACCEQAVRMHYRTCRSGNKPHYQVYGDDMVVPAEVTPQLIDILESFGFIVNRDKSYVSGPFRESCGKEYYEGYDVTPLYHRLKPIGTHVTCADFMGLCSAANNAAVHGLTYLRARHIDVLLRGVTGVRSKRRRLYPLFAEGFDRSPSIWSPNPSNFLCRKRWNKDLQVLEVEHLSVSSTDEEVVSELVTDTVNYFEFLVERHWNPLRIPTPDDGPPQRSVVPRKPVFSRSWTDWRHTVSL